MNKLLTHHHDHAVVRLSADLDWDTCEEALGAVHTAVDYYGYRQVELQVNSRGGNGQPLRHLLRGLDIHRERGVCFRTRVVAKASSAGAFLVALGGERIAGPNARLLFHGATTYRNGELSARECALLHTALLVADERMVSRLVDRAFGGPRLESAHEADSVDRVRRPPVVRIPSRHSGGGGSFRSDSVGHTAAGRGLWLSPGGQQPLLGYAALPHQKPGALLVR